jgi:energy-coupling factor transport system ATP-binding protein
MQRSVRRGRLRPAELAEAVVLADLSLALTVVGQVVPLGGVLLVAAVVPLAVVGARHRLRAVVVGSIAASTVGFLVIGTPAFTTMATCAAFGAVVGAADRHRWGLGRTVAIGTAILFPPIALIADLLLWVFSDLRKLTLDQLRNAWKGMFNLLHHLGLARATNRGDRVLTWIVDHWWLSVPIAIFVAVMWGLFLAYRLATPALRRVRAAFGAPVDELETLSAEEASSSPAPVPTTLHDVSFRYANARSDALHDVSATIEPGELVVVAGRNGSGKSTLARIIAGRRLPTTGTVTRPGPVGIGVPHGTAMVFQRPEAQVLGVRVRDDVVWGLHDARSVDVESALAHVGLAGFGDRETSTLSGGELQRLAVAAAIARRPQLLVSDEATAMVDADGRVALVRLLRDLATDGVSVVHVSHYANEADAADRTIALEQGRIATHADDALRSDGTLVVAGAPRGRTPPVVELRGVGHVYSRGTPWAKRALTGIDLTIEERESLLVVGHNGSGKSTLAWIVAGLTVPSEGTALMEGEPIAAGAGRVGLSFQHARLQLLRPSVLDDVRTAAGIDEYAARRVLGQVGLDADLFDRRVDELSGGQMRRVVLAGVLAARPRVIVLDEPFAGLDFEGRADLERLLVRIRDDYGVALLIVSHDRDLPDTLVERVVELDNGRIARSDIAAESENP